MVGDGVIAVLGAGTIGASWAALFAASGREVCVYDPMPEARARVEAQVQAAADTLAALGHGAAGSMARLRFTDDPIVAVRDAVFIQENVPERLEVKHALYAAIEPGLAMGAVIATSTSGLKLSALQEGLRDPSRLVLAHPFNPPHLIPLVELMGNGKTAPGLLDAVQVFFEALGKVCIRLNREATGHVANRLQAAVWREAIHLMNEGVASVADIDRAMAFGPGLRWSVMGPSLLFHLGGGEGGIRHFCDHIGGPMQDWWDDLGDARLTPEVVTRLAEGIAEETGGASVADLAAERDRMILAALLARKAAG